MRKNKEENKTLYNKTVVIKTKTTSYFVKIGFDLIKKGDIFFSLFKRNDTVVVITDQTVHSLYFNQIYLSLLNVGVFIHEIVLEDGEKYKSLNTVEKIFSLLLKKKCSKETILIALGGGVIGDLVGFIASCYQRGLRFIQIPTTLLSQVDSSIGGKNAVNYLHLKNFIGFFYQPIMVLIDLNLLKTLSQKQISSGLAEVVKYGVSLNYKFFIWLEKKIEKIIHLNEKTLFFCILQCCILKKRIIFLDEKEEKNERVKLNFGHTFAHAIESSSEIYSHGESVSLGIVMATRLAESFYGFKKTDSKRVVKLLKRSLLPTFFLESTDLSPLSILDIMLQDKKSKSGKLNLVLPISIGKVKVFHNVKQDNVLNVLNVFLKK